jgi:hypothetical protein
VLLVHPLDASLRLGHLQTHPIKLAVQIRHLLEEAEAEEEDEEEEEEEEEEDEERATKSNTQHASRIASPFNKRNN